MITLRQTGNPLDRGTRNDINYNWQQIETSLENSGATVGKVNEDLTQVKVDTNKLKVEMNDVQVNLGSVNEVIDNLELGLLAETIDNVKNQGNSAQIKGNKAQEQGKKSESQGAISEEQGLKAQSQGNKAEEQGNYAKAQGDYARDKAQDAASITEQMQEAHKDLPTLKAEAIEATQGAKLVAEQISNATEGVQDAIDATTDATEKALQATSGVQEAIEATVQATADTVQAIADAEQAKILATSIVDESNKAKAEAIEATQKANEATQDAITATADTIQVKNLAQEATESANTATLEATQTTANAEQATASVSEKITEYDKFIQELSFKQVYDDSKNYNKNNIVLYEGSSYIALKDVPKGNVPVIEGTEFWHLLARRGNDGDSGIKNINGAVPDDDGNVVVNTATDMKFTNTAMDIFAGRNIIYSDTEPDNPQDGDMWVDTSEW